MWKQARIALLIVGGIAMVFLAQLGTAGANTGAENPAGVSCIATPNNSGFNELLTFDLNGFDGNVFLRRGTGPDSSQFVTTVRPESEVSSGLNEFGSFIRYRMGGDVFDVPCETVANPNPAGISCTAIANGANSSNAEVNRNGFDGTINIRRATATGSSWLASLDSTDTSSNVPGDGEGLLARYRIGSAVFDVPCESEDNPNPAGLVCEFFPTGNDEISLIINGDPTTPPVGTTFIRELTATGSEFVGQGNPTFDPRLPAGADYIVRYRQGGRAFDVPCLQLP